MFYSCARLWTPAPALQMAVSRGQGFMAKFHFRGFKAWQQLYADRLLQYRPPAACALAAGDSTRTTWPLPRRRSALQRLPHFHIALSRPDARILDATGFVISP